MRKRVNIPDLVWSFRLDRFVHQVKMAAGSRYARKTASLIKKGMDGLGEEAGETKVMAESFFRLLATKLRLDQRSEPPTREEVKAAIEQLKDVGRFSIFASISLLPGGGFSLIGLELLARRFGVKNFTLVPSAFRKKEKGD